MNCRQRLRLDHLPQPGLLPDLDFPPPAYQPAIGIAPEAQMPFFRTHAFHLDDAALEKYCRPADFFACDTLMQEEVDEAGVPHANETCEQDLQALKS